MISKFCSTADTLIKPFKSDKQNIDKVGLCLDCPNGYTCPLGTVIPILGSGIAKGDLAAAIIVPLFLLLLVLIIFFCCYRKWKRKRGKGTKMEYIERPVIGYPVPAPVRQPSSSSSSEEEILPAKGQGEI